MKTLNPETGKFMVNGKPCALSDPTNSFVMTHPVTSGPAGKPFEPLKLNADETKVFTSIIFLRMEYCLQNSDSSLFFFRETSFHDFNERFQ
jgi:hypothetical protein